LTFAKYTSAFGLIHDSVLTLPGQMEGTINKLKATFVDMYSEDVFAKWWKQIGLNVLVEDGQDLLQMVIDQGLITMGDFDINQVMDSEYFFS
jgi:DNA-directed RNA polymerase